MAEMIAIAKLRRDSSTQSRAALDPSTVESYTDSVREGAKFPPVVVYHDGTHHWLADGFHRVEAHVDAGRDAIEADIRAGTQRDAILFACGANATHGLRRTTDDKRRAVILLLRDPQWTTWSDHEIARRARVSQPFVGKMRSVTDNVIGERQYRTKHGTVATMAAPARASMRSIPIESLHDIVQRRDAARKDAKRSSQEAIAPAVAAPPAAPPPQPKLTVSARERKVLVVLAGGFDPYHWRAFNFKGIGKGCDVEPNLIRRVVRSLARKGLAHFERSLWDEYDGTPAGAGYRCTQEGFDFFTAHLDNSQKQADAHA